MLVAARVADTGDMDALTALYAAFRDCVLTERGAGVYLAREAPVGVGDVDLSRLRQDEGRLLLAGTIDGVPVGIAVAHLERLAEGRRLAVLEVLYVDKAAREVGVGECLVEAVAGWAGAEGAVGLDVLALPGMREAKNLFETLGFAARLIVMHRRLDTGDGRS